MMMTREISIFEFLKTLQNNSLKGTVYKYICAYIYICAVVCTNFNNRRVRQLCIPEKKKEKEESLQIYMAKFANKFYLVSTSSFSCCSAV